MKATCTYCKRTLREWEKESEEVIDKMWKTSEDFYKKRNIKPDFNDEGLILILSTCYCGNIMVWKKNGELREPTENEEKIIRTYTQTCDFAYEQRKRYLETIKNINKNGEK
jgi:hypothetical protein